MNTLKVLKKKHNLASAEDEDDEDNEDEEGEKYEDQVDLGQCSEDSEIAEKKRTGGFSILLEGVATHDSEINPILGLC